MAEEQGGEKTEQPTDHRRQEARKQGRFAKSQDLTTAGHLFVLALGLMAFGLPLMQSLAEFLRHHLEGAGQLRTDSAGMAQQYRGILEFCGANVMPLLLGAFVASLAVGMAQVGFIWLPELMKIDWSHLDPVNGFKRMFSPQSWIRLAGSLAKLLAVGLIAAWFIRGDIGRFLPSTNADVGTLMLQIHSAVVSLALVLALTLLAIALADYGWQKWSFERGLMMTRQELIDEMKQQDGDPKYRHLRREAHQKMLKSHEVMKVKEADVVIINPIEIAIAVKYDPERMPAPVVVAKGKGEFAARIRQIAAECNIPIIERRPLAQALFKMVKVGRAIPVEMYDVFVEIMKYVYQVTGKTPNLPRA